METKESLWVTNASKELEVRPQVADDPFAVAFAPPSNGKINSLDEYALCDVAFEGSYRA